MASTGGPAAPSFAYTAPRFPKETRSLLRVLILAGVAGAAISSRLFSVIRHESVIHEFDPWFNYRATRVLVAHGFKEFWNWFDPTAWYPLGRVVGGTIYPGLMLTSGLIHSALRAINVPVDIRNICVLLAPAFSGVTAYVTYLFTREVKDDRAGLLAAAFIGIAPGYISRSVAGSYDNEAIAITLLMLTFYLWVKALKLGSALWATLAACSYYYMVSAWGGYAFIINMVPLHVFVLLLMGRYSPRLYMSYCAFYAIGTLASMQVPFVGFLPVRTSDHMAALGIFGLLQIVAFTSFVRSHLPAKQFDSLLRVAVVASFVLGVAALVIATMNHWIAPWTGRFYSLWDTGYAKIHIPIIASVSEHQPTAWPSFFFDLQMLIYLFPAGIFLCFRSLGGDGDKQRFNEAAVFVIIYAVLASYFAGVMVRLMLTLTPVVCVAAAVALSTLMDTYIDPVQPSPPAAADASTSGAIDSAPVPDSASHPTPTPTGSLSKKAAKKAAVAAAAADAAASPLDTAKGLFIGRVKAVDVGVYGKDTRGVVLTVVGLLLSLFVMHCTWVTAQAYSSPSVVLATRGADGNQHIIDDFREAYNWINQTTPEDAVIASWWDYGYQIAGMAGRTTLVDNNTWNNTHIATVGKIMSSREEVAYPILRKHDVTHVLVIFGGLLGYSGDDINKFLWMVRIAEGVWPDEIRERDYFTQRGEYKVDADASPAMQNSLMYKMSYHRFADLFGGRQVVDRVRQARMPAQGPQLDSLEEAFTSENWLVRIYEVKKEDILGRDFKSAKAFEGGKRRKRVAGAGAGKAKVKKGKKVRSA